MNKKLFIILGSMLLTFLLIVGTAKAVNLFYQADSMNLASTTAAFQIGGISTTTKTASSDGFGRVSYLVTVASSSTVPTLCWRNQFSDNGTDWYGEFATSTNTTGTVTDKVECWDAATTTDTSNFISRGTDGVTIHIGKRVDVFNLNTGLMRTVFYLNNGQRARVDVKRISSNEVVVTK